MSEHVRESQRLRDAYRVLTADVPELSRASEQRMWRRIEAKTKARTGARRDWALGLCAATVAAALAAVMLWQPRFDEPGPPKPQVATAMAPAHSLPVVDPSVRFGPARWVVSEDAILETPVAPDRLAFRLTQGRVNLDVEPLAPGQSLTVWTPHATVQVIGTRFSVEVASEATSIEVQEGRVRVIPQGRVAFALSAGQSARVDAAKPLARASSPGRRQSPEPEPEPAPEPEMAPLPDPPSLESLLDAADDHRRHGRLREATAAYRRVWRVPDSDRFAEEAMLREARLRVALDEEDRALDVLGEASKRFGPGHLGPERLVLAVQIDLEREEPIRAATRLEATPGLLRHVGLLKARIATARALLTADRKRAEALLMPVLKSGVPALRRSALKTLYGNEGVRSSRRQMSGGQR